MVKNAIEVIKNGFVLSEAGTKRKPFPSDFAIFTHEDDTTVQP